MSRLLSVQEYVDGILSGDRIILSRAITLVESSKPEHMAIAEAVIEQCLPYTGNTLRIGITGVPGVGKSTFIEALGMHLTGQGKKLAVLAVDPSSTLSKGSILGDKTRMDELSRHADAYIRPTATGGSLGGVARKTRESIALCEAAGYEVIFVETVGVGQSETAVNAMVDFFLLLMLSGAGDELQGIKRGIMEMADGMVITKADGENVQLAKKARKQYQNAMHLLPAHPGGWVPKVLTASALEKTGISEVWHMLDRFQTEMKKSGYFDEHRREQNRYWLHEIINQLLQENFYSRPGIKPQLQQLETAVLNNEISALKAARQLTGMQ